MAETKRDNTSRKARPKFHHPQSWKLECPECGKMLVTSYNLRQHMRLLHSSHLRSAIKSKSKKITKTPVRDDLSPIEINGNSIQNLGEVDRSGTSETKKSESAHQSPDFNYPSPAPSSAGSSLALSPTTLNNITSLNLDQTTSIQSAESKLKQSTRPRHPTDCKREEGEWTSRLRKPTTRWRPAWDRNGKLKLDPVLLEYYLFEDLESVSSKSEEDKKQKKIKDYWIHVLHKKSRKC